MTTNFHMLNILSDTEELMAYSLIAPPLEMNGKRYWCTIRTENPFISYGRVKHVHICIQWLLLPIQHPKELDL